MIREIIFFLGLEIVQNSDGIFISQTKYLNDLLKWFGLETCILVGTPMIIGHESSNKDETHVVE